jgi:hypothetical protein
MDRSGGNRGVVSRKGHSTGGVRGIEKGLKKPISRTSRMAKDPGQSETGDQDKSNHDPEDTQSQRHRLAPDDRAGVRP